MKYFIDIAGDWFTCTSNLEKNASDEYEFKWGSDFQSGVSTYKNLEGNVVEISASEYKLLKMIIENEELVDYQLEIKVMIVERNSKEESLSK